MDHRVNSCVHQRKLCSGIVLCSENRKLNYPAKLYSQKKEQLFSRERTKYERINEFHLIDKITDHRALMLIVIIVLFSPSINQLVLIITFSLYSYLVQKSNGVNGAKSVSFFLFHEIEIIKYKQDEILVNDDVTRNMQAHDINMNGYKQKRKISNVCIASECFYSIQPYNIERVDNLFPS